MKVKSQLFFEMLIKTISPCPTTNHQIQQGSERNPLREMEQVLKVVDFRRRANYHTFLLKIFQQIY